MSFTPNLRRTVAVARVETLQIISDRASLVLIFVLPIFQILLYGYAISLEPRNVALALASSEPALAQRASSALGASSMLHVIGPAGPAGSAEKAVEDHRAQVGLELSRDVQTGAADVRIVADPGDPAEVRPALAAIEVGLWRSIARLYAQDQAPVVTTTWLHNPADANTWMVAPGLIGMIVMVTMLFMGGLTLVRERERGSWETLLATPVQPAEALIGKLSPYIVIALIQTVLLLAIIHWLFGVPLPLTVWALLLMTPFFAGSYLVLGFAISTLARTQIQAVQSAAFLYLPSMMLSGFMFPFTGMPPWAQAIGEVIPLTHYIRATRDILIRGEPPASILAHLWPVLVFISIASGVAVASYRRRLD